MSDVRAVRNKKTGEVAFLLGDGRRVMAADLGGRVSRNKKTGEWAIDFGQGRQPLAGVLASRAAGPETNQPQPPRPSAAVEAGQSILRSAGLALGSAGKGVLDVLDFAATPIYAGINAASRGLGSDYRIGPGADLVIDRLGLPKPRTADDKILAGGTRAMASILPTLGAGLALTTPQVARTLAPAVGSRVAATLAAEPKLQALSGLTAGSAQGLADVAGYGPQGQAAASIVGGLVPGAAISRNLGGRLIDKNKYEAFTALGQKPGTLDTVSNSRIVRNLGGWLDKFLPSSGVMERGRLADRNALGNALNETADAIAQGRYIPPSLEEAGQTAQRGLDAGRTRLMDEGGQLFENIAGQYGGAPTHLDELHQGARNYAQGHNRNPLEIADKTREYYGPLPQSLLDASQTPRGTTFRSAQEARTKIGKRLAGIENKIESPVDEWHLNQVYGNLSDDMMAALPPQGQAELAAANALYGRNADTIKAGRRLLEKKTSGEAAARAMMKAGTDDQRQLRTLLGDDLYDQLTASALLERGRGSGAAGNAGQASANWLANDFGHGRRRLDPMTMQAMFGQNTDRVESLGRLAHVLQESSAFANPSGTAIPLMNTGILGAIGVGLNGGLTGIASKGGALLAAPWLAGHAYTSPRLMQGLYNANRNPTNWGGSMVPLWVEGNRPLWDYWQD